MRPIDAAAERFDGGNAMRDAVATAVIAMALGGCGMSPEYTYTVPPGCPPQPAAPGCPPQPVAAAAAPLVPVQPVVAGYANPILIPVADPQCAWETVVDVVDDYFRIEHEEPVRVVGNMLTEGAITTAAEVSPTIFEPWRPETADMPQRIENTLQTMRRRAVVRVIPAQGGQWVDVQVFKDLEDARPEHATAGAATFRYDTTLTRIVDPITGQQNTRGWIAQGRDAPLEQRIIGDLLSRCGQAGGPVVMRGQAPGPAK
jgi:hypothetical protein